MLCADSIYGARSSAVSDLRNRHLVLSLTNSPRSKCQDCEDRSFLCEESECYRSAVNITWRKEADATSKQYFEAGIVAASRVSKAASAGFEWSSPGQGGMMMDHGIAILGLSEMV